MTQAERIARVQEIIAEERQLSKRSIQLTHEQYTLLRDCDHTDGNGNLTHRIERISLQPFTSQDETVCTTCWRVLNVVDDNGKVLFKLP